MFVHFDEKITGSIRKDVFDGLPDVLKEEFLNKIRINSSSSGRIDFEIPEETDADELWLRFRNYEKNKNRSIQRKENLYTLSSGTYESEDISSLYSAQEGRCYYTGDPLNITPSKNFAVDHIVPVTEGGSSWPGNLALTTVVINREKHNLTKRKLFSMLEKRNGKDWIKKQKEFCKRVDIKRRTIDKKRRASISARLAIIEDDLRLRFPGNDIDYSLVRDDIYLFVNYIEIAFPPGFIRQKEKCFSSSYIARITDALLSK